MATVTRPELSERNPYYINRERYFELKHFCLQYNDWKKELEKASRTPISTEKQAPNSQYGRVLEDLAINLAKISSKIEKVDKAAKESGDLQNYILQAVTKGLSCNYLIMHGMPCCKDTFYKEYRKFFYILDKLT